MLLLALACLAAVALAAWSTATGVALFSANRLRLRHLARGGARGARAADDLLGRPERLAALLAWVGSAARLACGAAAFALGWALGGMLAALFALGVAIIVVAILAELLPRAVVAPRAERWSRRAAPAMRGLYAVGAPLTDAVLALHRVLGRGLALRQALRIRNQEELAHAKPLVQDDQRRGLVEDLMLLSATVGDAMVPRAEIVALDLAAEWEEVLHGIEAAPHRVLPVVRRTLDDPIGMLTVRRALALLRRGTLDRRALLESMATPYFVPAATPLQSQLLEFQRAGRDLALVVDEYGATLGLVTLADVVAELASALGAGPGGDARAARADADGAYLVGGSTQLRSLNRTLGWDLPTEGPRTVNGLVLEQLEAIPAPGTSLRIVGYNFEVVQTSGSAVKTVRIRPPAR